MSDTATHDAATASHDAELFSPVEVEQFSADDVSAGGAIGKMLSALFLYTVLAMGISSWWTHSSIVADKATDESNKSEHAQEQEHGQTDEKVDH